MSLLKVQDLVVQFRGERRRDPVVRAVAAAAGTYPAVVVERAIEAYLAVHPELAAVAAAALAAGAEHTAENPGSPTDRGA